MQDKIERTIELKAPIARVWRALSDYKEFGQWFCLDIKEPFKAGQPTKATLTYGALIKRQEKKSAGLDARVRIAQLDFIAGR